MGYLRDHAEAELSSIGYDENCEEIDLMMRNSVLELIDTFSEQGHSGMSAQICVDLFKKLASYKPLGPIKCTEDEWTDVSNMNEGIQWFQNKRLSAVFKEGENANPYYLDAIVWRDPDGCCFTGTVEGITSYQFIKLPFTPKTFYVDITEDRKIKNKKELNKALKYYLQLSVRTVIVEKCTLS